MAMNEIATLQQMIDESRKVVFFGGAGVSTRSEEHTSELQSPR